MASLALAFKKWTGYWLPWLQRCQLSQFEGSLLSIRTGDGFCIWEVDVGVDVGRKRVPWSELHNCPKISMIGLGLSPVSQGKCSSDGQMKGFLGRAEFKLTPNMIPIITDSVALSKLLRRMFSTCRKIYSTRTAGLPAMATIVIHFLRSHSLSAQGEPRQ